MNSFNDEVNFHQFSYRNNSEMDALDKSIIEIESNILYKNIIESLEGLSN